jgi:hypothetical protein
MKKKQLLSIIGIILVLALSFFGFGEDASHPTEPNVTTSPALIDTQPSPSLDEDGHYNSKEDVALYIHLYGHLPENYITKSECEDLGYAPSDAEDAVKDGAIGGDRFGNREGLLPKKSGRTWTECDIDTWGKSSRGAKRIVFSNDGLVYYTHDHYESFELLYGEP